MNWMTSGKHRALYSKRGRRRQMRFPSQVQQQRVKHSSPPRNSQPRARDSATPWYIVPVGDDDESQDIRVLELERRGAMSAADVEVEARTREKGKERSCAHAVEDAAPSRQKRSRAEQEKEAQEKSENRCIFTPVKKARKYDPPIGLLQRVQIARGERPPSSIASGVDMLFFNDGEELPHKKRTQENREPAQPAPSEGRTSRYSQRTSERDEKEEQQFPYEYYQDEELQSRHSQAKQDSLVEERPSYQRAQSFSDCASESYQRDFQLWRVNSNSFATASPDTAFDRPESEIPRNPSETFQSLIQTPPSPFAVSPLSFRMSRAEVVESQITNKTHAEQSLLDNRVSLAPSPRASPSPSTSTSSQGSIVLGRPPLGWQRRLMMSLTEDTSDKPEQCIPFAGDVPASPTKLLDSKPKKEKNLSPGPSLSSRSSRGSDSENSIADLIVPIDAKERILAATSSQQPPEASRGWLHQPTIPKTHDTNGADSVFTEKSMAIRQSWVMSSRTKRILDAVSTSNAQNTPQMQDTKYQEMQSVAIYMCTLVQCYKIDESLRCSSPVAENTQLVSAATSPPSAATFSNRAASRREISFSPKHAN